MTLSTEDREAIKAAFRDRTLQVKAVDPLTGAVKERMVSEVYQHESGEKNLIEITLDDGRSAKFTLDHSVFVIDPVPPAIVPVRAGEIRSGSEIITVCGDNALPMRVKSIRYLDPQPFTYDLAVPGVHNFVLTNGILAHNSYSIGGVSLDISKSDKYKGMKDQAEARFKDEGKEVKLQTLKIIRGLRQPKYGVGIRSAFGSFTGRGVLGPRSFLGF